jgi:acyl transferase domain-containing protein
MTSQNAPLLTPTLYTFFRTAMLTEKAEQVRQDIETLKQARDNQKKRERFQDRREMLRERTASLASTVKTMTTLASHGVPIGYDGANVEETVSKVKEARTRFEEEPQWIIDADLSELKRRIQAHRRKIDKKVQSAWRTYYEEKVPDLSSDVLDVFERFADFAEDVNTIRRCSTALQKWKDTPPASDDEFDAFERLVEKRDETWRHLRSDDLPEEVLEFLVSAGSEGATAAQYTEAVRSWLDNNDLHDRVRLYIRN